jgi:addiction module HigA family antidote
VLAEELATIEMSQQELAKRTGRPTQVINEIIRGKKAITPDTALALEKVLGIPAHVWVNLESLYRLTLARNREGIVLDEQVRSLSEFPVKEMEERGWIPHGMEKRDKTRAILDFLAVASFPAWREAVSGPRITGNGDVSVGALAIWLRKGELDGRHIDVKPYDEKRFREALVQLRLMTAEPPKDFAPKMRHLCAQAGVALVFTQELPKSGANGAARWLTENKALIQLSLKWRWHDVFWFSFFHEAHHVLSHHSREIIVDGIDGDPRLEREADAFARDFLIPPAEWESFIQHEPITRISVREFAQQIGIAPGIVVGRLQHEKHIPFHQWTDLKWRLVWASEHASDNQSTQT